MSTSTRILIRGAPAPWQTMAELVRGKADAHGDRVFATIDGRTLTYRELDQLSGRVAANLAAAGIEEGACVASVMFNCVEQVLGWVGSGKAGALWAPLNASLVGDDLAQTLADAQPNLLIVDAENAVKLAALPRALLDRMQVYCTGPVLPGLDALPFAALLEDRTALSGRERGPGDPALILYTGGTTGLPKGVVLPHFAVVSAGYRYGETLGATAVDRHYTTLPLFHASGIQLGIVGPLLNDITTVMDRRFSGPASGRGWSRSAPRSSTLSAR